LRGIAARLGERPARCAGPGQQTRREPRLQALIRQRRKATRSIPPTNHTFAAWPARDAGTDQRSPPARCNGHTPGWRQRNPTPQHSFV